MYCRRSCLGLFALAAETLRLLHSLSLKPEGMRLHQTASVPFCAMSEGALKRLDVLLRHFGRTIRVHVNKIMSRAHAVAHLPQGAVLSLKPMGMRLRDALVQEKASKHLGPCALSCLGIQVSIKAGKGNRVFLTGKIHDARSEE